MELTVADEIADTSVNRPHVVLLGAGASRAALPRGDRNGRVLPVMADFVDVLGLQDILGEGKIAWRGRNFEDVYADLHGQPSQRALLERIEGAVFE